MNPTLSDAPEHEQIEQRNDGQDIVVALSGQFTGGEETEAAQRALQSAGGEASRRVVVDMAAVTYVNSSFIGALLAAHTSISRTGGTIVLHNVPPTVAEILRVTRLDLVFETINTISDSTKGEL